MKNFKKNFHIISLTGIFLLLFAVFLPAEQARSAKLFSAPQNAISSARKRTAVPEEEIQALTNSSINQQSLEQALQIKKKSATVIPELEEYIITCYWQLGRQKTAVEMARIYLMTHESPAMHRILLKDAIARKDLDKALFHYEKSKIKLANKPFFFQELLSLKYNLPAGTFFAVLLAFLAGCAFCYRQKRRKAGILQSETVFKVNAPLLPPLDIAKPVTAKPQTAEPEKLNLCAGYSEPLIDAEFAFSTKLTKSFTTLNRIKPSFSPSFSEFKELPTAKESLSEPPAEDALPEKDSCPVLGLPAPKDAANTNEIDKADESLEPVMATAAKDADKQATESDFEPPDKIAEPELELNEKCKEKPQAILESPLPKDKNIKPDAKPDEFINSQPFKVPEFDHENTLNNQATRNQFEDFVAELEQYLSELDTRIVGITSSSDITNRTCFAYLLGKVFADKNHETLVIDADFSRPRLNLFTDSPCMYGLKHLLGPSDSNQEIFVKTEQPGLSIFPSGTPDEKQQSRMGENFWDLTLSMSRLRFAKIILVLPNLKKLENIKLYKENLLMLTLLNPKIESSINEYYYSKIMLKRYNMKLFKTVKLQDAS